MIMAALGTSLGIDTRPIWAQFGRRKLAASGPAGIGDTQPRAAIVACSLLLGVLRKSPLGNHPNSMLDPISHPLRWGPVD